MVEEFDWDYLVAAVRGRRVTPIIGRELSRLGPGRQHQSFESWLAGELVRRLGLPGEAPRTISEVARSAVRSGVPYEHIYRHIHAAVGDGPTVDDTALKALAGIEEFELFVTTAYDGALARAVEAVRGSGTRRLSYNGLEKRGDDLRIEPGPNQPVVYQLFGELSPFADFAATEQDVIEVVQALQMAADHQLGRLFDRLRSDFLLLIGTDFPDWLSRFFIRVLKGRSFREMRDRRPPFIAECEDCLDGSLASFLREYGAVPYQGKDPTQFVLELAERCAASGPAVPERGAVPEPGSIFLSYAREDAPVVRRVHEALAGLNLRPWMDTEDIEPGADWEYTFQRAIEECYLFIPFISRATETAARGYYFQEWRIADQVARRRPPSRPFVVPILLDGVNQPREILNTDSFRKSNWVWAESSTSGVEKLARTIQERYRSMILRAEV